MAEDLNRAKHDRVRPQLHSLLELIVKGEETKSGVTRTRVLHLMKSSARWSSEVSTTNEEKNLHHIIRVMDLYHVVPSTQSVRWLKFAHFVEVAALRIDVALPIVTLDRNDKRFFSLSVSRSASISRKADARAN